eukprot:gnl/Dysnectes_brevis/5843_a8671_210.p1 GENE.gnl/Dysnectes_brevis/5843_a8671_210~~gnl/Dysnectes_brevis/5843_a8671_210.p1  ORF type:complete len:351 (-),score=119.10 gnl/Dysnectes_brevis/5843_a8671_210:162-1214(-)
MSRSARVNSSRRPCSVTVTRTSYTQSYIMPDPHSEQPMEVETKSPEETEKGLWDAFYQKHKVSMYLDRHWLWLEFPELSPIPHHKCITDVVCEKYSCHCGVVTPIQAMKRDPDAPSALVCPACRHASRYASPFRFKPGVRTKRVSMPPPPREDPPLRLADLGCGVGNTAYPLLEKNAHLRIDCFDFSAVSLAALQTRPHFSPDAIGRVEQYDLTQPPPSELHGKYHFVVLMFVLSAIPHGIPQALRHASLLLGPHGTLFVHDYAAGDMREDKFAAAGGGWDNGLGLVFTRAVEGTKGVYFRAGALSAVCRELGLVVVEEGTRGKEERNRKTGEVWDRRFMWLKLKRTAES